MLKEVLTVAKVAKKSSLFLGGVAFGTLGLKVLASKEAKKGYSKALAKAYSFFLIHYRKNADEAV